jgi:hypothetical protein
VYILSRERELYAVEDGFPKDKISILNRFIILCRKADFKEALRLVFEKTPVTYSNFLSGVSMSLSYVDRGMPQTYCRQLIAILRPLSEDLARKIYNGYKVRISESLFDEIHEFIIPLKDMMIMEGQDLQPPKEVFRARLYEKTRFLVHRGEYQKAYEITLPGYERWARNIRGWGELNNYYRIEWLYFYFDLLKKNRHEDYVKEVISMENKRYYTLNLIMSRYLTIMSERLAQADKGAMLLRLFCFYRDFFKKNGYENCMKDAISVDNKGYYRGILSMLRYLTILSKKLEQTEDWIASIQLFHFFMDVASFVGFAKGPFLRESQERNDIFPPNPNISPEDHSITYLKYLWNLKYREGEYIEIAN